MLVRLLCLLAVFAAVVADIDFALVCDKGYRVSAIRRTKTYYSTLGTLTVECEQIALPESTTCAPQANVPKCTGLLEGCSGDSWLGGFHAFQLENATQATVRLVFLHQRPTEHGNPGFLLTPLSQIWFTEAGSAGISTTATELSSICCGKTEICPFVSREFPVITRSTDCEECSCACGVEQCSNGVEPVRVIHRKLLFPVWLRLFLYFQMSNTLKLYNKFYS
ncbi:unnamed protein product [Caenorhabditis auriculariae]|uniref:Uncharacterized protein n=1 Tax=Caenorhabditis auriculariae TaxID=2777116 RepID=A0A8S1HYK3_9PELO|nr:unnamed protein product [Caenorhabditis auriculariae]